jgi:hypothetical protein
MASTARLEDAMITRKGFLKSLLGLAALPAAIVLGKPKGQDLTVNPCKDIDIPYAYADRLRGIKFQCVGMVHDSMMFEAHDVGLISRKAVLDQFELFAQEQLQLKHSKGFSYDIRTSREQVARYGRT